MAGQGNEIALLPGQLYLGGTMTSYGVLTSEEGCVLSGIRFLPGGFYAWFGKGVAQAVDSVMEFPQETLLALMVDESSLQDKLNRWFLDKANGQDKGACDFLLLRKLMYESQGQVSVQELARQVNASIRTLQRLFKKNVGIPPKERRPFSLPLVIINLLILIIAIGIPCAYAARHFIK